MDKQRNWTPAVVSLVALFLNAFILLMMMAGSSQAQGGTSNFEKLAIWSMAVNVPTSQATGVPGVLIDNNGVGNALEVRNVSGTPVYQIAQSGATTGGDTHAGGLLIDGNADEIQLQVQGFSTQNAALMVLENSAGADQVTVSNTGDLVVEGTSNLKGNVSDSGGVLTVADNVLVDAQADAEQMVVQGHSSQSQSIFVVEQVGGTDVFEVSSAGVLVNDYGVFDVADNMDVGAAANVQQFTVQGHTTQSNALFVAENSDGTDLVTIGGGGDLTIAADPTGGNAGARNQLIGLPKITAVTLATMTNGTTENANYLDDTPTGEWTEIDAGTNLVVTADTAVFRVGTTALKLNFTDVVTDDGVVGTAGSTDDLGANESIGFWMYSDVALASGDFTLTVDDSDGTDQVYNLPVVPAGVWTWVEIDVGGCDANCDTMTDIRILASAQGGIALGAAAVYFDGMWKWDADNEEALSVDIVQDGVFSLLTVTTDAAGANTMSALVEQTGFLVNYQSGADVLVTLSDQSANSGIALVAVQ